MARLASRFLAGTAALALACAPAAGQTVKIPQLPDAGVLTGNELTILDQGAKTRKATLAVVTAYIASHLPPLTSQQMVTALGYVPVNRAGDTMLGPLGLPAPSPNANDNNAATTGFAQALVATLKAYIAGLLQANYTLQVPSAAALRNLVGFPGIMVHRGGFFAPGDGGMADYAFNAVTCPNGDDGGTCLAASGGGSWRIDPTSVGGGFVPQIFGAKCDGSLDQTAIQAAMDAAASLGVRLTIAPKGKTCLVTSVGYSTGAKLAIEGTLKGNATNSVLYNKFANGTSSAPEQNVVIEGDGTIDGGFSSQPASTACLLSIGAVQYLTVRNVTLKNCGNWPFNIVGNTGTPYAGAKHVYISYVKATGPYSFNSAEFQGCDDCWADHYSSYSVPNDYAFAFYGNVTNSGITNSRLDGSAIGIGVLSDGTPGQSITAFPSSDILIGGNIVTNMKSVAISLANSTGVTHKNIKLSSNEGYGNNKALTAAAGVAGLYVQGSSNVESSGNRFHNDGAGNNSDAAKTHPVVGIYLAAGVDHFTSNNDAIVSEGSSGGFGLGATIEPSATNVAFFGTIVSDSLPTPGYPTSMLQAFNGGCSATCKIMHPNLDATMPFGNIALDPQAVVQGPIAWRSTTAALTCGSGSLTSGSATVRYSLGMDKRVALSYVVNITTNGSCAGALNVALPPGVTVPSGGYAWIGGRNQSTGKMVQAAGTAGATSLSIINPDNSYPGADGTPLALNGQIELQ